MKTPSLLKESLNDMISCLPILYITATSSACISFLVSDHTAIQLHQVNPGFQILSILNNIENQRRFTFFQNCSLSVPTYLPLGVDILELAQAGLYVELFFLVPCQPLNVAILELPTGTCHLA